MSANSLSIEDSQHSVALTSLQPGTTYYYQIHSINKWQELVDVERNFTTQDGSEFPV